MPKNKTNLPPNSHYCNENNNKVYWKIYLDYVLFVELPLI